MEKVNSDLTISLFIFGMIYMLGEDMALKGA
jgi:hypothetical protein